MTHQEFINQMATKMEIDTTAVEYFKKVYLDKITEALAQGNSVSMYGFGNFELKEKSARKMFNPTTKQYSVIPAKWTLGFRPSPILKEKIANNNTSATSTETAQSTDKA